LHIWLLKRLYNSYLHLHHLILSRPSTNHMSLPFFQRRGPSLASCGIVLSPICFIRYIWIQFNSIACALSYTWPILLMLGFLLISHRINSSKYFFFKSHLRTENFISLKASFLSFLFVEKILHPKLFIQLLKHLALLIYLLSSLALFDGLIKVGHWTFPESASYSHMSKVILTQDYQI